jgi:hypothetical protein
LSAAQAGFEPGARKMGRRLVSKLLSLFLQVFFALFWLGVAAYAVRRTAGWLFETARQCTIVTAAVLGAFIFGCAVNPSFGVASHIGRIFLIRSAPGIGSAMSPDSPCSALRTESTAPPLGHIDDATMADKGTAYKLQSGAVVPAQDTIGMHGWMSVSGRLQPAAGICLVVDGSPTGAAKAYYGISRPDVAAALSAPQLDASGFDVRFAVSSLTPGRHRVQLGAFDAARKSVAVLGESYTIDVEPK